MSSDRSDHGPTAWFTLLSMLTWMGMSKRQLQCPAIQHWSTPSLLRRWERGPLSKAHPDQLVSRVDVELSHCKLSAPICVLYMYDAQCLLPLACLTGVELSQLRPLAEFVCPICFSPPTNATLTPCGHVCCGECLFMAVKVAAARAAASVTREREPYLPRCVNGSFIST